MHVCLSSIEVRPLYHQLVRLHFRNAHILKDFLLSTYPTFLERVSLVLSLCERRVDWWGDFFPLLVCLCSQCWSFPKIHVHYYHQHYFFEWPDWPDKLKPEVALPVTGSPRTAPARRHEGPFPPRGNGKGLSRSLDERPWLPTPAWVFYDTREVRAQGIRGKNQSIQLNRQEVFSTKNILLTFYVLFSCYCHTLFSLTYFLFIYLKFVHPWDS